VQLFSCPGAEVITQSTKRNPSAAETGPRGGIRGIQFPQDISRSAPTHARSNPIVTSADRAANHAFDLIRVDGKNMPRPPKTATIR
jgi:hypothetical protein